MQSISKGFLKLENVVFGERVEDAVDVLVGEYCERHVDDVILVYQECSWWERCFDSCVIGADRCKVRGSDSICRAD